MGCIYAYFDGSEKDGTGYLGIKVRDDEKVIHEETIRLNGKSKNAFKVETSALFTELMSEKAHPFRGGMKANKYVEIKSINQVRAKFLPDFFIQKRYNSERSLLYSYYRRIYDRDVLNRLN